MMRHTLAAAILLAAHTASATAQSQFTGPIVQVGIYSYRADGSTSGAAYDTAPSLESAVYVSGSLCQAGAGFRDLPAMAAYAWRFKGKVLSQSAEEAVVEVEWQRVLDRGNKATTPGGSVQLTLRAGDRVPLDSVTPMSGPFCPVTSAAFEVRYMSRQASFGGLVANGASIGAGSGARGGAGGGRAAGIGAGSGGGGGAGSGIGIGSGPGSGSGSGGGSGGSGSRGGISIGAAAAGDGGSASDLLAVSLWLVHGAPGRQEEVIHQVLRSAPEGAIYAFAPVTIDTPQGKVVVQVSGSFTVRTSASGAERLIFITSRRVTLTTPAGVARVPDAESVGNTNNVMPGPDDVLSFEMPPVKIASAGISLPDQFSVRVRIAR